MACVACSQAQLMKGCGACLQNGHALDTTVLPCRRCLAPVRATPILGRLSCFCVRCLQNDSVLYTASGDQHVGVWDTTAGRLKMYCSGHDGSVKVVTPHTSTHDIFASGAWARAASMAVQGPAAPWRECTQHAHQLRSTQLHGDRNKS